MRRFASKTVFFGFMERHFFAGVADHALSFREGDKRWGEAVALFIRDDLNSAVLPDANARARLKDRGGDARDEDVCDHDNERDPSKQNAQARTQPVEGVVLMVDFDL